MKIIKNYVFIFLSALLMLSFTLKEKKDVQPDLIKIEIPLDNSKQSWGSWTTTDCFRGLDFRVRNDGFNKYAKKYRWSIQFRNRYKGKIHFSYKAVPPNQKNEIKRTGRTTDRLHIDGNYGTRGSYYLVKSSSSIYVYINRVRIGNKDYGSEYIQCDK